jgi:hypothetical protein
VTFSAHRFSVGASRRKTLRAVGYRFEAAKMAIRNFATILGRNLSV